MPCLEPEAQVQPPAPGRAEDFLVEEVLRESPGRTGDYAVYQATKRWLTTPQLQQRPWQVARLARPLASKDLLGDMRGPKRIAHSA